MGYSNDSGTWKRGDSEKEYCACAVNRPTLQLTEIYTIARRGMLFQVPSANEAATPSDVRHESLSICALFTGSVIPLSRTMIFVQILLYSTVSAVTPKHVFPGLEPTFIT